MFANKVYMQIGTTRVTNLLKVESSRCEHVLLIKNIIKFFSLCATKKKVKERTRDQRMEKDPRWKPQNPQNETLISCIHSMKSNKKNRLISICEFEKTWKHKKAGEQTK